MSMLREPLNETRSSLVRKIFEHLDTAKINKLHYSSLSIIEII
jgi:hypothetical protein